ncbi:hypothetical protein Taro_043465 [Colocasia esculenta]|uniref:Uncharacterized protein n=1 Tax=Colocasia esculenta TaxID=4460 RepID=A0A843WJI8_COLES|nr:hypothetical protein [Colocasia esculenta]
MTTDYPSPCWRLSGDPDWVAYKNDFRQLRDIVDMLATTLQRVVYEADPAPDAALEDEYYRQIGTELSKAYEDIPVEKHEPMTEEIMVDQSKPIVDATSMYDFDHI